mgnify:CR=1 FL=1
MIRCLAPSFEMLRSSLAGRPRLFAIIIQNVGQRCVLSVQSREQTRQRLPKTTAAGTPNMIDVARMAVSAKPASALSP